LVVTDDRLPRAILDGLEKTGATIFPGTPVLFEKLADLENAAAPSQLRLCISAGAPLRPAIGRRFSERFGLKIHTFYGASECGGIGYDASGETEYVEGFVGTPLDGVQIVPREDGHIEVRSAAVGDGYFPESNSALGEGRFVPDDFISQGNQGMTIVGRASDVINVAGRKLNPADVEQRLRECPGVRQTVVFGVPSSLRGEEAVACIVGEGIDRESVLRFCRANLSQWQVPRDIWIVREITTNERGKISRRALAEKYRSLKEQC
jgi:acyl-CoA synthetase (AMP-forming)/AMP-acid ligase II